MRSGLTTALLIAVLSSTTVGCTKPTPTPTPTYTCTADTKRPAGTCSPQDANEQAHDRALFEEAERVYRAFTAEYDRLAQLMDKGDARTALSKFATGSALEEAVALLKSQQDRGIHTDRNIELRNFRVNRAPRKDAITAISVCEDGRNVAQLDKAENALGHGRIVNTDVWFRRLDGRLVFFYWYGKEADQCAG